MLSKIKRLGVAALIVLTAVYFSHDKLLGGIKMGPPDMGNVLTSEEKKVCGITASVTEGPYYVSGMGEVSDGNINYNGQPGTHISVSGYVYEGLDNSKPLKNVVVEVWSADSTGKYLPNGNGAKSKYSENQLGLRGFVKTDENGKYTFTTIYPGEYSGRTTHIHIKIKADGFRELTTQLILPAEDGHDEISFDEDTVSKGLPNCHLLKLSQNKTASFDFRLEK